MSQLPDHLMALIHTLEERAIKTCDIELADGRALRLRFSESQDQGKGSQLSDLEATEGDANLARSVVIKSSGMGRFSSQHPLDDSKAEFTEIPVRKDDIVGYLSIGETIQPIISPDSGRLVAQWVTEGQLVGYGDAVYSLEPAFAELSDQSSN